MKVTPKAITFAIHRVLTIKGVTPGCSISMPLLLEAWRDSMLRRGDLIEGLELLRKTGYVALEQTAQGPCIRLLKESFGLVRTAEDREALSVLSRARAKRQRHQPHLAHLVAKKSGRRPGDPVPTPPTQVS